ncbi:cardiolipin synthase [Deinococcus sp. HSC-46F16]|uniref:phospholipase D-like domain-containing protein n=1 Tax=Deinococcus sp. HSC-46F16 TaxID=2910968 RepID=UPI0020A059E1|nr:phospholipase D-like domain-containing protein [Deinococcus sp. HSC-46F16]MCP2013607.1 cardiolipin synthase [Deinococcus sp. HSC-46F16]
MRPRLPRPLLGGLIALLTLLAAPGAEAAAQPLQAPGPLGLNLPPPDRAALDGLGLNACPEPTARLDRLLYERTGGQGAALSCGNRVEGLLHLPQADPAYSAQPRTPQGGYDALVAELGRTRRELVIANMIWDEGADAPGASVALAIAALRRDLAAHPERYPAGLTVRLLFGNTVRASAPLDPRANIYAAAEHLLAAGVPLTGDTVPGWRLELASYAYTYPHSHMKVIVQDGERVLAGGFNISINHLPGDAPGGRGLDLADQGIWVRGPVARHALAAVRDTWELGRLLTCTRRPRPGLLRRDCTLAAGPSPWPLVWPTPAAPAGEAHVYPLYRRNGYTGADQAMAELFGASRTRLDIIQSQIGGTFGCVGELSELAGCAPQRQLPVWRAVVSAIRDHGVTVRLLLDYDPALQAETLGLLRALRLELRGLGLDDHLQARWYGTEGGAHTKMVLVDDEMLVVGSHNLHFSSFGRTGLVEYSLATSDAAAIAEAQGLFDFEWARGTAVKTPWWLPALPGGV